MSNLKFKIKRIKLYLFLIALVLSFTNFHSAIASNTNSSFKLIVLYSNSNELTKIQTSFQAFNISNLTIDYSPISNFDFTKILNYNMMLLASSSVFQISDTYDTYLTAFLTRSNHSSFVFTPYLNDFSDSVQSDLGISNFHDFYPENGSLMWDVQSSNNTKFSYTGKIGIFDKQSNFNTILSVTNTTISEDINYPQPILINSTSDAYHIITGSFSIVEPQTNLNHIFQIPFSDYILNIIKSSIVFHINNFSQTVNTNLTDSNLQNPSNKNPFNFPSIQDLLNFQNSIFAIYILISLCFFVLFNRILGLLKWLQEKSLLGIIFIVGAFYNVQERTLSQNEILINQTRVKIVQYLEYMGEYGAHLREIKSKVGIGVGTLLWHLQVLHDYGWIEEYKIGRFTVYVSSEFAEVFDPELKALEFQLKSKHTLNLLSSLIKMDYGNLIELNNIVEKTQIDRKTVRRLLKILEKHEIIDIIKEKSNSVKILSKKEINQLAEIFRIREDFELDNSEVSVSSLR